MITLTGNQIKELAELVGLIVTLSENKDEAEDILETEITLAKPPDGIVVDKETGKTFKCNVIAYYSEYPEEGVIPLNQQPRE